VRITLMLPVITIGIDLMYAFSFKMASPSSKCLEVPYSRSFSLIAEKI
jgi:hypothetical protein